MELVEIKVKNDTFILQLPVSSVINDLSLLAYDEYRKTHPKETLYRILCVKDNKGRILAEDIPLFQENKSLFNGLECILEDYTSDNTIFPTQILQNFHSSQLWSVQQILKYIESVLIDGESKRVISKDIYTIISNVLLSESLSIQLTCLRCFHLLLARFHDDTILKYTIQQITYLMNHTTYSEVVDEILISLITLSSDGNLQKSTISILRTLPSMILIDTILLHFPQQQAILLHKYQTLLTSLSLSSNLLNIPSNEIVTSSSSPYQLSLSNIERRKSSDISNSPSSLSYLTLVPISSSSPSKTSLLSHDSVINVNSPQVIPSILDKIVDQDVQVDKLNHLLLSNESFVRQSYLFALKSSLWEYLQRTDIHSSNRQNHQNNLNSPILSSKPSSPLLIESILSSPEQIERLTSTLLQLIKNCIVHSKRSNKLNVKNPTRSFDVSINHRIHSILPSVSDNTCKTCRIINKALNHSNSDLPSIVLALECLEILSRSIRKRIDHDTSSENNQMMMITIFTKQLYPSLRLLLTLSHASDSFISKTSAYLLLLVIKSPELWESYLSTWTMEKDTIIYFLSCRDLESPRFQIAFSYLTYLLNHQNNDIQSSNHNQKKVSSINSSLGLQQILSDILSDRDYDLTKSMISWLDSSNLFPREIQILAFRCLCYLTTSKIHVINLQSLDITTKIVSYLGMNCIYSNPYSSSHVNSVLSTNQLNERFDIQSILSIQPIQSITSILSFSSNSNQSQSQSTSNNQTTQKSIETGFDIELARYAIKILSNLSVYESAIITTVSGRMIPIGTYLLSMFVVTLNDKLPLQYLVKYDDILSFHYNMLTT